MDLKLGGKVGKVEVPPHSEREYLELWGNGAILEMLFYSELQNDEPSDRIHLMITDSDGARHGWLMNVEDAIGIIRGLSVATQKAIGANIPTKPAT